MFTSIRKLQHIVCRQFNRLQTKGKHEKKAKEVVKQLAATDDKFIKLSKKEDNSAKTNVESQLRNQRMEIAKTHDFSLDKKFNPIARKLYQEKVEELQINLVENPLQTHDLMNDAIKESSKEAKLLAFARDKKNREVFNQLSVQDYDGKSWREVRKQKAYFNAEAFINEKYAIQKVDVKSPMSRRTGALAYKMGMTSVFDKWGHLIPLTVLQIDRCQVLQVKSKAENGYDALQLGCGEKSLNTITKPMIGLFMKAMVPPKRDICEFTISPENSLPVGYMIGVRHFTVGQWIDVKSNSKGKGFQGGMKRWGFDGQPASHGCSLTHRNIGSTGNRQDPGRVFKGKKMPGRMGNKPVTVRKLQVYKIDYEKSLIYVKGSIPGPAKRLVHIYDALYHWKLNQGKLNYPTFVYEKDMVYADVLETEAPEKDPTENWLHENAILSDEEEEGAGVTTGV